MAVVCTDTVNLFFVTLNAVGGTDVVAEDPGLSRLGHGSVDDATCEKRGADDCEISVDCILLKVTLRGT